MSPHSHDESRQHAREVGDRLAYLRAQHHLTQTEAAHRLDISRSALSQIESGQTLPSYMTLRKARDVFGVSYMYLMEGREEASVASLQDDLAGGRERAVAVTVDEANNPNIILVPARAQAGYAANRLESSYLEGCPTLNLPGLAFRHQTFRAFEVAGDSMMPTIHNGDILICTHLSNWYHLWPGELYVIVLEDDVLVKRCQELEPTARRLRLASDNSYYRELEVDLNEVAEIWKVYAKLTLNLPAPEDEYDKLRRMVEMLRQRGVSEPPMRHASDAD